MEKKIGPLKETSTKVSVIIPFYNRNKELEKIVRLLNRQTFKEFEVIFVDDCSSIQLKKHLNEILRDISFKFTVIRNECNRGVSYSRNIGVAAAIGKYVAFLDSDDSWYDTKLEECFFACETECCDVFCFSQTVVVNEYYSEIKPKLEKLSCSSGESYLFEQGLFAQVSSFFISRGLAQKISFDESLNQYEDYLYFIKAFNTAAKCLYIAKPLVYWNDLGDEERLSKLKNIEQSKKFISKLENFISCEYISCFYQRHVLPYYFYHDIYKGIRNTIYCLIKAKMPAQQVLFMVVKGLLGDRLISKIRNSSKSATS